MSNWIKFTEQLPKENELILYRCSSPSELKMDSESDPAWYRSDLPECYDEWQKLYTQGEMDRAIEQAIADERESQSQSELDDFLDWPDEF